MIFINRIKNDIVTSTFAGFHATSKRKVDQNMSEKNIDKTQELRSKNLHSKKDTMNFSNRIKKNIALSLLIILVPTAAHAWEWKNSFTLKVACAVATAATLIGLYQWKMTEKQNKKDTKQQKRGAFTIKTDSVAAHTETNAAALPHSASNLPLPSSPLVSSVQQSGPSATPTASSDGGSERASDSSPDRSPSRHSAEIESLKSELTALKATAAENERLKSELAALQSTKAHNIDKRTVTDGINAEAKAKGEQPETAPRVAQKVDTTTQTGEIADSIQKRLDALTSQHIQQLARDAKTLMRNASAWLTGSHRAETERRAAIEEGTLLVTLFDETIGKMESIPGCPVKTITPPSLTENADRKSSVEYDAQSAANGSLLTSSQLIDQTQAELSYRHKTLVDKRKELSEELERLNQLPHKKLNESSEKLLSTASTWLTGHYVGKKEIRHALQNGKVLLETLTEAINTYESAVGCSTKTVAPISAATAAAPFSAAAHADHKHSEEHRRHTATMPLQISSPLTVLTLPQSHWHSSLVQKRTEVTQKLEGLRKLHAKTIAEEHSSGSFETPAIVSNSLSRIKGFRDSLFSRYSSTMAWLSHEEPIPMKINPRFKWARRSTNNSAPSATYKISLAPGFMPDMYAFATAAFIERSQKPSPSALDRKHFASNDDKQDSEGTAAHSSCGIERDPTPSLILVGSEDSEDRTITAESLKKQLHNNQQRRKKARKRKPSDKAAAMFRKK